MAVATQERAAAAASDDDAGPGRPGAKAPGQQEVLDAIATWLARDPLRAGGRNG